jgi:hypothetical protein
MDPAYKIVPYILAGCVVFALVTAVVSLIAAVVGWRGPHRKRRLWRCACCLAAIPVLGGLNYVYVHQVVLPGSRVSTNCNARSDRRLHRGLKPESKRRPL